MRRLMLPILALLLAACAAPTEDAAAPTSIRLGLSYAAQAQRAALLACIPADGAVQIELDLVLGNSVDIAEYDLLIRLGEAHPMPEFAVQLGQDQVLAAFNPANPLRELDESQLPHLFSGRVNNWEDLGGEPAEVRVWIGLEGDETRQLFRLALMQGAEFSGGARLATSPESMADALEADANAIGLLPASLLPEGLRGIPTGISAPVLALASSEPEGTLRDLIACLHGAEEND